MPVTRQQQARKPANAMKITRITADFDAPDPAIARLFSGDPA